MAPGRFDTHSLSHPAPRSHHDPINRTSHSSSPSSSTDRVTTPPSGPDPLAHICIPPDVPDNLAYHIYKIQTELASTPPAPTLYFDSKASDSISACDIFSSASFVSPVLASPQLSACLEAPALSLLEPHSKRYPGWFGSFSEGIRTTDPKRSAGHALDVIRCSLWNHDGYIQLVQWLCWKAAAVSSPEKAGLVLFTSSLVDKFGKFAGQEAAMSFLEHLDQGLITRCQSAWASKSTALSPRRALSELQVSSAIRLLSYMGQLHALRILHPGTIHQCLGMLIDEMTSIEHIEAIHVLIERSTATLWSEDPSVTMFDFIHAFTSHTRNVSNISIRGNDCAPQEIYRRVSKVVGLINGWQDEMEIELYGESTMARSY